MLFEVSHHVGFAIAPSDEHAIFQRIDFVPLSQSRVLVVMVARGDHVSQKVVDIGEPIAPSALTQAANYLNSEFAGRPLAEVRAAVLARLEEERTLYDQLLAVALRLARTTLEGIGRRRPCSSTAPRRWPTAATTPQRCRWRRCARCCAWSRRSSGW